MSTPHPTEQGFGEIWGEAWSCDPDLLATLYASDATYTDVAMDTTVRGPDGIAGYQRYMERFISDSTVRFDESLHAAEGHLTAEWVWSGTVTGPMRLKDGQLLDLTGHRLTSRGVAVCRYNADGLLTRHLDYWDLASMVGPAGARLQLA